METACICLPVRSTGAGYAFCRIETLPGESVNISSGIRRKKVRAIRRQLRLGKYDIPSRLAAIFDRVLDEFMR